MQIIYLYIFYLMAKKFSEMKNEPIVTGIMLQNMYIIVK
jgi:hypothetical protein